MLDLIMYQCPACGFKLDHVPRAVVAELPRCLGCGRDLRAPKRAKKKFADVKDLR